MFGRRLNMFLRDREVAVIGALAILTTLACALFLGRLATLRNFYLSPSYRRDAIAVLGRLRDDTGWGLSNFQITGGGCNDAHCDMTLAFAYHGPKRINPPSSTFRVSWTEGKPESYAVQVH